MKNTTVIRKMGIKVLSLFDGISCGNGWTVDVIVHILKGLPNI